MNVSVENMKKHEPNLKKEGWKKEKIVTKKCFSMQELLLDQNDAQ